MRLAQSVLSILAWLCGVSLAQAQDAPELRTVAEKSDYRATARHNDVIALCKALCAHSDYVKPIELGNSHEGRPIPGLVVADPPVSNSAEAKQSGKLVVVAIGNIHAGEVDGKEALPMLVRDLTSNRKPALLRDVILVVVPNINPDGNERMSPTNRPGQVGPDEGMGTRENALGLDLNRDFVKLESPEIRALVQLFNEWNPHLFIDTHTTNGSHHRFTITHAGPKSPAGNRALNDFVHLRMLASIDATMDARHGWKTFPYGNFDREHTRWTTYGSEPRYGTTYFGLRNGIGILSEAYAYAPFKDRVLATRDFVATILAYCADNSNAIKQAVAEARSDTKVGDPVAIRSALQARPNAATALGFVETTKNGRSIATEETKDYIVELWDDFRPKESVARPIGYIVPAQCTKAIAVLRQHGLDMHEIAANTQANVEVYKVNGIKRSERAYQGHRMLLDLEVEKRQESLTAPSGGVFVSATGALGSLAVMLLEPRSEDSLATWECFENELATGRDFPVMRVVGMAVQPASANAANTTVTRSAARPQQQRRAGGSPPVRVGTGMRATFVPGAAGFVRWLDNDHYIQLRDGKPMKVSALTGDAEAVESASEDEDRSKLEGAFAKLPTIGEVAASGLARRATLDSNHNGAFANFGDDLYFGAYDGSAARRLTSTPGAEELAEFSPDGQFVAFVRDNDLYVVDVETGIERALTSGGNARVRHGKADWVYFEEIFNRSWKAFWWSPDSKHIAFLKIDDRAVPTHHVLVDTGATRTVEETAYPRPGEPNPQVQFGIVGVAGGAPTFADLSNYTPDSFLISDAGWWPDSSVAYFYAQDRTQTWLDVLTLAPGARSPTKLFRETTGAWVESLGDIHVLKDKTFLVSSERDGWKHLYRYKPDGALLNRVTSGEWEARAIAKIDEDGGWVYLNGTRDNPLGNNLYRARLDGSAIERITDGPGTHAGVLNPDGTMLVDLFSSREQAPRAVLRKADGKEVRSLENGEPATSASSSSAPTVEFVQIKARDGTMLDAEVSLPPDIDKSGNTLYPVWFTTYGGPHAPTIRDGWSGGGGGGGLTAELLRKGFIIFRMDPRSASGKGAKSAWAAYRKLGVQELEDVKDAIAWLKERPYVDGSRIGMSGHSYGGYLTAFCMTHSDLFAAGIAGAPVTDWRDYDSIYTERYMGTPQDNPEGYEASSVTSAAGNLHGKLLILHGGIDDNVSVRNTMRFIHALQQADKDFELMIYPSSRHGIGGAHYGRLQREFILRTLGGPKPRDAKSEQGDK